MKPLFYKTPLKISCLLALVLFISGAVSVWADSPGEYTEVKVSPNNLNFQVKDPSQSPYIETMENVKVTSEQQVPFPLSLLPWQWTLTIRAKDAYIVDNTNPANRIPISQLQWSLDGVRFTTMTSQWVTVTSYWDWAGHPREETVIYRIINTAGSTLPDGNFSVQIEFKTSLTTGWDDKKL